MGQGGLVLLQNTSIPAFDIRLDHWNGARATFQDHAVEGGQIKLIIKHRASTAR